jgi:O-antigen ligase
MQIIKKITPENTLFICITALFFVTPLSSSLKSIFLIASITIILTTPTYRQEVINLLAERFFLSGIFLVLFAAGACLWSPASTAEKLLVLEKWSKILYLPCLVVALKNPKLRKTAIDAFIIAMAFTCLCSFYSKIANLELPGSMRVDGIFRNHIMTSIMTSFAAYLAGSLFLNSKNLPRILYLLCTLLTSSQILFINESRTGYVVYLLLMSLLIIQKTSKIKALLGVISICGIFVTSCFLNHTLLNGIQDVKKNLASYQTDKNTSIGYRLQFHSFAENIFKEHPIIGSGTASFTYKFRTENPVPAWTSATFHSGRLLEPHGQYWLVAAEFGSIGLIALLLFYAEIIYRTFKLENMRDISLSLFIILALGNLTDSLLFYSGSGYFFILFFALAFSEKVNSSVIIHSLNKSINKAQPNNLGKFNTRNL